jgi:N-acetyl-gamma-glutamyl-phosphate reductase
MQDEFQDIRMVSVGIVGASGYSGGELLRLLTRSDRVSVKHVTAQTQAGLPVGAVHTDLARVLPLTFEEFDAGTFDGLDCAFVALPSGEAMQIVPALQGKVGRIIDLGGDFRLPDAALYERYYGRPHTVPGLLGTAVYGLPELHRERIRVASLVANPGCYPTSAILGLLPALARGIIRPAGIVINALSGVSGAGRSKSVELSFSEVNENIRAYKIGTHQHIPEIRTVLAGACSQDVSFSFIPHLVPLTRGIYSTIHADPDGACSPQSVQTAYEEYYRSEPFVRVMAGIPEIKNVVHTNFCNIATHIEPHSGKLVILSVIDNLVKGAAGQAIQNFNILFGLPEHHMLR